MQTSGISATNSCQPLKQFAHAQPIKPISFKNDALQSDTFSKEKPNYLQILNSVSENIKSSDSSTKNEQSSKELDSVNAKYDVACRLAAYYKKLYESAITAKVEKEQIKCETASDVQESTSLKLDKIA